MGKTILLAAILLAAFVSPASGITWYVDGAVTESGDGTSWQTAFKTIQQGIDAASLGDTVLVAQGTYVENIKFNGKSITLTSTDPLNPSVVANTIVDGNHSGSVVTFSGTEDETCVLSGFTITRGEATYGGGICGGPWDAKAGVTIENNTIRRNRSHGGGGGIAFCHGVIRNNTISGNSDEGEDAYGGGLSHCGGVIEGNVIAGNSAVIDRWTTTSSSCGGGLFFCRGIISRNLISANSAWDGGGLDRCHGSVIEGNIVSGNIACDGGGGLHFCSDVIRNNLIIGNRANPLGDWSWAGGGGGLYACDADMDNNTVVGNYAFWFGGGLAGGCRGKITNCIFWGNFAAEPPQLDCTESVTFCCVQDWTAGGEGNISTNPLFLNPEGIDGRDLLHSDKSYVLRGDFRLKADSPCIDAGFNDPELPETDIAGMRRIMFGGKSLTVDMGAYEYYINKLESGPGADQAVLTWSSLADKTYSIFYSHDLLEWDLADDRVGSAADTTTSWLDDGSRTGAPPLRVPRRLYRILENP